VSGRPIALLLAAFAALSLHGADGSRLDAAVGAPHDIRRLDWLAGCWERQGPERHTIEQWTAPRGGMMLGLNQTMARGRTVAWEYLRIAVVDGRLVLTALPTGQAETSFDAIELTDSSVVFSNPQHDFPQTVSYHRQPDGSLLGHIEGTDEGKTRGVDFPFDAVPCDGGSP
jgi:hypothetical protein